MANPDSARRNLVRFSLRNLLVLTAISAVLCGWLGIQYANCQRESAIVAELAAAGVSVKSFAKSDRFLDTKFRGQFFRSAHDISLGNSKIEHCDLMELVGQLPHVRALEIQPDSDLRGLDTLVELRSLVLTGWTCDSLHGVENCKKLESLYLYDGDWIDTFEPLRGMSNLRVLYQTLENSSKLQLDPEVVATWANLREIELLFCEKVDLAGFENLRHLEVLDISHADEVTGFESLQKMTSLRRNSLPKCAMLKNLDFCRQLSGLEELVLYECRSLKSIEGISQLKMLEKVWLTECLQLNDLTGFESIKSLKKLTLKRCEKEYSEKQLEALSIALPGTNIRVSSN